MTREDIVRYLKKQAASVFELATVLEKPVSQVEEDLKHIRISLRDDPDYKLMMQRAECELCGYIFTNTNVKTPTRCPECRREKIKPAVFRIEKK